MKQHADLHEVVIPSWLLWEFGSKLPEKGTRRREIKSLGSVEKQIGKLEQLINVVVDSPFNKKYARTYLGFEAVVWEFKLNSIQYFISNSAKTTVPKPRCSYSTIVRLCACSWDHISIRISY